MAARGRTICCWRSPWTGNSLGENLAAWSPLAQLAKPGRKPPLFLARAGADEIPGLLGGLDAFVSEALAQDYPLTLINNPGAPHGFDIGEATPGTLEVLAAMFAFLRRHLGMGAAGEPVPPAPQFTDGKA